MMAKKYLDESLEILKHLRVVYHQEDPFLLTESFLKNGAGPTIEEDVSIKSCESTFLWYQRMRNALVCIQASLESVDGLMGEVNLYWDGSVKGIVNPDGSGDDGSH